MSHKGRLVLHYAEYKTIKMILVTRLNGSCVYVNAELIRLIEATPDTVLSLVGGEKVVVRESPQEVVTAIIAYRRQAYAPLAALCMEEGCQARCDQRQQGQAPTDEEPNAAN